MPAEPTHENQHPVDATAQDNAGESSRAMSRRRFLLAAGSVAGLAAAGAAGVALGTGACSTRDDDHGEADAQPLDVVALSAIADLMIPATAGAPAPSELGVVDALLNDAAASPDAGLGEDVELTQALQRFLGWVRRVCRERFQCESGNATELAPEDAARLLALCDGIDSEDAERRWDSDGEGYAAAQHVGRELAYRYYSHEVILGWIGHPGAPQPIGYADHDKPARPT